jgi:hypothetical protein
MMHLHKIFYNTKLIAQGIFMITSVPVFLDRPRDKFTFQTPRAQYNNVMDKFENIFMKC